LDSFNDAINEYKNKLQIMAEALDKVERDKVEDSVRDVLVARNNLAQLLKDNKSITADEFKLLSAADHELKNRAEAIISMIERAVLIEWRQAIQAPSEAWWWFLDQHDPSIKLNYNLFLFLAGLGLITFSLSYILEFVRRFLTNGVDLASGVLLGLLGSIAGVTVYQVAKQFIEALSKPAKPWEMRNRKPLYIIIIILILLAFGMEVLRPRIARFYNDRGVKYYERKQLTNAIYDYQRAVSLNPPYSVAHFNLGNAYEDVLDYDKAMTEYQNAIQADSEFYRPYDNLARLYILYKDDSLRALTLIEKALPLNIDPEDDANEVHYRMYKNRGWANLKLKSFEQARIDLEQALSLRADGGDAVCLMAQVLEEQKRKQEAKRYWTLCRRLAADQRDEVEPNWSGLAQEHLK
jgi:tetratricopeptide (TPR) repeat protein